jgi:hypothetical protein
MAGRISRSQAVKSQQGRNPASFSAAGKAERGYSEAPASGPELEVGRSGRYPQGQEGGMRRVAQAIDVFDVLLPRRNELTRFCRRRIASS